RLPSHLSQFLVGNNAGIPGHENVSNDVRRTGCGNHSSSEWEGTRRSSDDAKPQLSGHLVMPRVERPARDSALPGVPNPDTCYLLEKCYEVLRVDALRGHQPAHVLFPGRLVPRERLAAKFSEQSCEQAIHTKSV